MTVRLASWNVNGIRACTKNGFLDWLQNARMDVIGLQEVRAEVNQIPPELAGLTDWTQLWFPCRRKKGYSGVGILARKEPLRVVQGQSVEDLDCEGRVIAAEFEGFWYVSAYFPNSGDSGARLPYKLQFCEQMLGWLNALRAQGKPVILGGDYNIAHRPIDLARPAENETTSGYLPEERAWMEHFLNAGWVDTFRAKHPEQRDAYSWWSMRMRARERNVGWRIDYQCVAEADRSGIVAAGIQPEVRGSDHCPVTLEFEARL